MRNKGWQNSSFYMKSKRQACYLLCSNDTKELETKAEKTNVANETMAFIHR